MNDTITTTTATTTLRLFPYTLFTSDDEGTMHPNSDMPAILMAPKRHRPDPTLESVQNLIWCAVRDVTLYHSKALTVYLNTDEPVLSGMYAAVLAHACEEFGVDLTLMHCVRYDHLGHLNGDNYMEQRLF